MVTSFRYDLAMLGVAACALATTPLVARPPAPLPAAPAAAPAAFAKCAACHTVTRGSSGVGPSLAGVIGAKAGKRPGFTYSPAMKKSTVVWSRDTLNRFILNPAAVTPGTIMPNPGAMSAADRAAIVNYIATLK